MVACFCLSLVRGLHMCLLTKAERSSPCVKVNRTKRATQSVNCFWSCSRSTDWSTRQPFLDPPPGTDFHSRIHLTYLYLQPIQALFSVSLRRHHGPPVSAHSRWRIPRDSLTDTLLSASSSITASRLPPPSLPLACQRHAFPTRPPQLAHPSVAVHRYIAVLSRARRQDQDHNRAGGTCNFQLSTAGICRMLSAMSFAKWARKHLAWEQMR